MSSPDVSPVANSLFRFVLPKSAYLTFAATFSGDMLFAVGQSVNDVVTSSVGATIVVVSTIANVYLAFKRKKTELDIETKVKYREEMRVQKEKDLRLVGKIKETLELEAKIVALKAENNKLRKLLEENLNGAKPNSGH